MEGTPLLPLPEGMLIDQIQITENSCKRDLPTLLPLYVYPLLLSTPSRSITMTPTIRGD